MKSLSAGFIDAAHTRLRSARHIAETDPAGALSAAYYAALYAARAALHEHGVSARTHRGAWHEFRQRMVLGGPIEADLAAAMQRLQTAREEADYDAPDVSADDARQAIDVAARFISQVVDALSGRA